MLNNHCHRVTAQLQLNKYYYYYIISCLNVSLLLWAGNECTVTKDSNNSFSFPVPPRPSAGYDLILEVSRSHSDTPHTVGLLWNSDQPDSETFTWQHTTLITDRQTCLRQDSKPQSQQASGRRPTL
jgi:hypothetical protein